MSDKMKVAIMTDTTSDLSEELLAKYHIKTVPLYVTLDGKTLKDRVEIQPDDIYAYYDKTKQLPKTSAANIDDHMNAIKGALETAEGVIYFTISSQMSSNFNNARLASEEFENVYVVDSENLSTGIGLQILYAADLAAEGKSAKEIYDAVMTIRSRVDATFVVESLEYLKAGGRCSSLAALGANLLKLRPCIMVRNGKMSVGKKYRGPMKSVLTEYAQATLSNADDIDPTRVFITHAGCDEENINAVYETVKGLGIFREIHITRAGCTISSHCGYGTLGVLFIRKSEIKDAQ